MRGDRANRTDHSFLDIATVAAEDDHSSLRSFFLLYSLEFDGQAVPSAWLADQPLTVGMGLEQTLRDYVPATCVKEDSAVVSTRLGGRRWSITTPPLPDTTFRATLGVARALANLETEEEAIMAQTETSRGRSQDRAKVAGGQDHEVRYESEKTGKSKDQVKAAVKSAGNSRDAVEKKLGSK